MWFGKKEERSRRQNSRQEKRLKDGSKAEESRVRLSKPVRNALWGTTTLIGKQKR